MLTATSTQMTWVKVGRYLVFTDYLLLRSWRSILEFVAHKKVNRMLLPNYASLTGRPKARSSTTCPALSMPQHVPGTPQVTATVVSLTYVFFFFHNARDGNDEEADPT